MDEKMLEKIHEYYHGKHFLNFSDSSELTKLITAEFWVSPD